MWRKMTAALVRSEARLACLAIAVALVAPKHLFAETAGTLIVKTIAIGFDGKYRSSFWQPVRLTVAAVATGALVTFALAIPDGDQSPVIYADAERGTVDLAAGEDQSVHLYAKSGPVSASVSVQLRQASGVAWSQD